jgi:hypothetical protein
MYKLNKQLRSILLENPAIQIKKSVMWHLPVRTYNVSFKPVKRAKMDILMKMMLLTFEQTEIRRAANLSELRLGLIRLEKGCYKLTLKGI